MPIDLAELPLPPHTAVLTMEIQRGVVGDLSTFPQLADAAAVAGMLKHWEEALTDIGFLDPASPKKLMPRLNQLFNRAQLSPEEIHILRGVARAMSQKALQAAGKMHEPANTPGNP